MSRPGGVSRVDWDAWQQKEALRDRLSREAWKSLPRERQVLFSKIVQWWRALEWRFEVVDNLSCFDCYQRGVRHTRRAWHVSLTFPGDVLPSDWNEDTLRVGYYGGTLEAAVDAVLKGNFAPPPLIRFRRRYRHAICRRLRRAGATVRVHGDTAARYGEMDR